MRLFHFGLLMSVCAPATSQTTPIIDLSQQAQQQKLASQRQLFLDAEHQAKLGNRSKYRALAEQIIDYPLAPYAHSLYLQRRLSYRNEDHIARFLAQYPDAPFSQPLRKKWLHYLVKQGYKHTFLRDYQDLGDAELSCWNLRWQLQQGATDEKIMPLVSQLWVAPKSQPKACDPLFRRWKEQGYLTSKVALERLQLAAKSRNWGLVPYLKTLLNDGDKHLAGMWAAVVRRPSKIFNRNFFFLHNDAEKEVFLYGVGKQIFSKPNKLAELWQEKSQKFEFSQQEQNQFSKKLALSFAVADHKDSLEYLQNVPDEVVDDSVKQWRLARSLGNLDWQQTLDVIASLPEQMQTDLSVVYWKARALEGLGQVSWAKDTFEELSERRDYYGFLAANKLGREAQLRHVPLQVADSELMTVNQNEHLQRAHELFVLGRNNDARREWNVLITKLSDREKLAASQLAYNWGWYDRPIFTLAQVGHLNDVNLRFPLAYKSLLFDVAKNNNLDPALLFAIARRESSFMADAYSSAGAAGLMQLKPSTASYIAKTRVKRRQLFEPDKNVDLGSDYWQYLTRLTKGNPVLTTAAYNAGLAKVKRWLPEHDMPADAWIETIPYKETRNYVKAVVAYNKVYQQLLSQKDSTFKDISNLQIAPSL